MNLNYATYLAMLTVAWPVTTVLAQTDSYSYGYEKQQTTTTDTSGNTQQDTIEKTWVARPSNEPAPADTPADKAANAKLGVTDDASVSGGDGQHSKEWYSNHLQQNGRYVYNPDTGKLEPVADSPEIHQLNQKARAKTGE